VDGTPDFAAGLLDVLDGRTERSAGRKIEGSVMAGKTPGD